MSRYYEMIFSYFIAAYIIVANSFSPDTNNED